MALARPASPTQIQALIVDDSPTQALLARQRLMRAGFAVRLATNGREARVAILDQRPAVVITDLHMPEMDGLALVEELRRRSIAAPVILMTIEGSESIAVAALKAGASGYVNKRNLDRDLPRMLEQVSRVPALPAGGVRAATCWARRRRGTNCRTSRPWFHPWCEGYSGRWREVRSSTNRTAPVSAWPCENRW